MIARAQCEPDRSPRPIGITIAVAVPKAKSRITIAAAIPIASLTPVSGLESCWPT